MAADVDGHVRQGKGRWGDGKEGQAVSVEAVRATGVGKVGGIIIPLHFQSIVASQLLPAPLLLLYSLRLPISQEIMIFVTSRGQGGVLCRRGKGMLISLRILTCAMSL